eukprot:443142-Rhodomonas_salina.4
MSGTYDRYAATRRLQVLSFVDNNVKYWSTVYCSTICLRAYSAMSSTDRLFATICLRACYAMSGTDMAYGSRSTVNSASSHPSLSWASLRIQSTPPNCRRVFYAVSGTDPAYDAIRSRFHPRRFVPV